MRELLDKIETRQRLVRETAERLREQITRLTGQLAAVEETLKRLVTRDILTEPEPGLFTLAAKQTSRSQP